MDETGILDIAPTNVFTFAKHCADTLWYTVHVQYYDDAMINYIVLMCMCNKKVLLTSGTALVLCTYL
jgi:hypothetical protein